MWKKKERGMGELKMFELLKTRSKAAEKSLQEQFGKVRWLVETE